MKTRKIMITAKASDKTALLKKYEIRDIEDPTETFEVMIEDNSEVLKELCCDTKIIHWEDLKNPEESLEKPETSSAEGKAMEFKEIAAVDLMKESIKRNLKLLDTRDMKTLLARLMCLHNVIEYRINDTCISPVTIVAESFELPVDQKEPVLSEATIKLMLRRMASCSKADFDKKLLDSMIETTGEYLVHPEYLEYTPDYFLKKIFEYTWKETN